MTSDDRPAVALWFDTGTLADTDEDIARILQDVADHIRLSGAPEGEWFLRDRQGRRIGAVRWRYPVVSLQACR